LWPYAEVKRGLSVREDFPGAGRLSNDWTLVGSPVVYDGLHLDGTNYARRNLVGSETRSKTLSAAFRFIPGFDLDDGVNHYFSDGNAGNRLILQKGSTGALVVFVENTVAVLIIDKEALEPYWKCNRENTIVLALESGGNVAYLNGVLVGTSGTPWSEFSAKDLFVGASNTGGNRFLGTIKEVKVFKQKLTQQEAVDYHNNETYCWRSKAVVDLPMRQAQHDPNRADGIERTTNGDFQLWTDPTVPDSYTKFGTHDELNFVAEDALGCRVRSSGTFFGIEQVTTVIGSWYMVALEVTSYTFGQIQLRTGSTIIGVLDSPGVFHFFFRAEANTVRITRGTACDLVVNNFSVQASAARTLDVSGNGTHAGLGDGSTASTIPDKSQTRGYRFDSVGDFMSGLPALSGDYTVVFAEPNNVSVDNSDTLYNQIQTPGGFGGHLLELVVVPELLTPTQVFDAIHQMRTQARMI
jgi:hypothetical protein